MTKVYRTQPKIQYSGVMLYYYFQKMTHWAQYGSFISRVFPAYFHTTDNISILWNWTKLWKLDFPTFFYNIYKLFPYYGQVQFFQHFLNISCIQLDISFSSHYTHTLHNFVQQRKGEKREKEKRKQNGNLPFLVVSLVVYVFSKSQRRKEDERETGKNEGNDGKEK